MTEEDFDHYEDDDAPSGNSQQKIFMYLTIALTVALLVLTYQYFKQVNILRGSEAELTIERDTLQNRLAIFAEDISKLTTENDTINEQLRGERLKADSLLSVIKKERNWSYSKIKGYENELKTMQGVMKTYLIKIDSLDRLNQKLSTENIRVKKELSSVKLRAESAEEDAQELRSKVRKGSVITARDIDLVALSTKDKEVSRARRASRLRVSLTLNANPLAVLGEREIYARIKGPGDVLLTSSSNSFFEFEGQKLAYSAIRSNVDYDGNDLAINLFYAGDDIEEGTYNVEIYMDGYMIGSNEIILK
ncbi:MAG: hypothetical protein R3Y26_02685 [Rikenellaceae bacterium]